VVDGRHDSPVDIWWKRTGHCFWHAGDVAKKDQPPLRSCGPSPLSDVLKEHPQVDDVLVEHGEPDGPAGPVGTSPWPSPRPHEERFDVLDAVDLIQSGHIGVVFPSQSWDAAWL
jgi:hypothetical protein